MRRASAAVGSDPTATEVAREHLLSGGDAVGAVVAGFFAAAGEAPGVLFAPVGLMLAQVGAGVRAFDGRQRQPGIGLRRARGLVEGDEIPAAARVAAPGSVAALLVALRYGRSVGLSRVVGAGVSLARQAGFSRRAEVLEQIQRLGASALASPAIARPLIHAAGPTEGGALCARDLETVAEIDRPAAADGGLRRAPWADERLDSSLIPSAEWDARAERQEGLCACDAAGGVAALCYDRALTGLSVEALELLLPLDAVPVRRGMSRVPPGTLLPAPTPLAIEVAEGDVPQLATVALAHRAPLVVRTR
jgi:hypothetical protein